MKKLSQITESIWSDMQDRGTGDVFKREDDIDLMDAEKLYQYVISKYRILPGCTAYKIFGTSRMIECAPIIFSENHFNRYVLKYMCSDDVDPKILIDKKIGRSKNLLNVLKENFKVEEYNTFYSFEHNWYSLKPLEDGRRTTNRFYLEVLDTFIDIIDPKIRPYRVAIQRKKVQRKKI